MRYFLNINQLFYLNIDLAAEVSYDSDKILISYMYQNSKVRINCVRNSDIILSYNLAVIDVLTRMYNILMFYDYDNI